MPAFSDQMATVSGTTAHSVHVDSTGRVLAAPLRELNLILVSAPQLSVGLLVCGG